MEMFVSIGVSFFFLVSFRDQVTKLVLFSRAKTEEEILFSAYAVDCCCVQCRFGCAGLAYGNDHAVFGPPIS